MKMTKTDYERIRNWIYRNARPVDLARWQYHFENGGKEKVLSALLAYQNEDGGFGHALEADSWNTDSSPIQTWTATEILKEIDFSDRQHKIIQQILNYLENCRDYKGGLWLAEIPSNNDYPHAPWWTYNESDLEGWGYNPTAPLLGFILYFGNKEAVIYQKALKSAADMTEKILVKELSDKHEISCLINYLDYVKKAGLSIPGTDVLEEKLKQAVSKTINPNTKEWAVTYTCKPSDYFDAPEGIFYNDNKELAEYECILLYETRNGDGVWDITWDWAGQYGKEFAVSEIWWKSNLIIKNMLYLRNFHCL